MYEYISGSYSSRNAGQVQPEWSLPSSTLPQPPQLNKTGRVAFPWSGMWLPSDLGDGDLPDGGVGVVNIFVSHDVARRGGVVIWRPRC